MEYKNRDSLELSLLKWQRVMFLRKHFTFQLSASLAFFQEFFQGVKSIVMLIFLLFSDQISGGSFWGQELLQEATPRPSVEESQKSNHEWKILWLRSDYGLLVCCSTNCGTKPMGSYFFYM